MEYELLGWPGEGVRLALDYRAFSYAGKFVTPDAGKAVATDSNADPPPVDADAPPPAPVEGAVEPAGPVVGAVAFDADRSDPAVCRLRYVTVRRDRRGEGIGPRLVAFTTERVRKRGFDRVKIAVNNPFAYQALYRAGFGYTGEGTGIAELVLEHPPPDRSRATYQAGLDAFRARDPDGDERAFLAEKEGEDPPAVVDPPE